MITLRILLSPGRRVRVDAARRAFCVCSADGKRRTNLAEDGK